MVLRNLFVFLQKKEKQMKTKQDFPSKCEVIDLFCGVGGLTHGFVLEGFKVLAGFDIDNSCAYAYEKNNEAKFIHADVTEVAAAAVSKLYTQDALKILVGCAPCQPFSSYNFKTKGEKKWHLLGEFARMIDEIKPDIVSMENVPQLLNFKKEDVLSSFLEVLRDNKYHVSMNVVECHKYGLPQKRKRLVLLASKLGEISIVPETHNQSNYVTVRDTIAELPKISHGEKHTGDHLHRCSRLTEINLTRIRQSKPGGTWRDWDEGIRLACHKKSSGKTYVSVYGRMKWDEPSPTITTQFVGIGNGRFGHPEQDRAISIREAALLQSFPREYEFCPADKQQNSRSIAIHIGNAVPVLLGRVIARSISNHLANLS